MTAPVRFGILGAANIARQFTRGVAGSTLATVDAVASRGAEKAAAFAAEHGIPRHHASYDALLRIDAKRARAAFPEVFAEGAVTPDYDADDWDDGDQA